MFLQFNQCDRADMSRYNHKILASISSYQTTYPRQNFTTRRPWPSLTCAARDPQPPWPSVTRSSDFTDSRMVRSSHLSFEPSLECVVFGRRDGGTEWSLARLVQTLWGMKPKEALNETSRNFPSRISSCLSTKWLKDRLPRSARSRMTRPVLKKA